MSQTLPYKWYPWLSLHPQIHSFDLQGQSGWSDMIYLLVSYADWVLHLQVFRNMFQEDLLYNFPGDQGEAGWPLAPLISWLFWRQTFQHSSFSSCWGLHDFSNMMESALARTTWQSVNSLIIFACRRSGLVDLSGSSHLRQSWTYSHLLLVILLFEPFL